jgi:hypothetical protein
MWLSTDHEKYDSRTAGDGENNTDLSPIHLLILRDIGDRSLGANSRKTDWRGGSQRTSPSCCDRAGRKKSKQVELSEQCCRIAPKKEGTDRQKDDFSYHLSDAFLSRWLWRFGVAHNSIVRCGEHRQAAGVSAEAMTWVPPNTSWF